TSTVLRDTSRTAKGCDSLINVTIITVTPWVVYNDRIISLNSKADSGKNKDSYGPVFDDEFISVFKYSIRRGLS
ncbi:MAG: hypothetical protein JKY19_15805, partial [Alcanivoracaceae bacterium]|nr:hypothetical protein [Alcanivoracaceae bacterium]